MEFMGESVYTKPFSDDAAVHFRHQAGDVTKKLQAAVDELKREKGYGIVFLEEGDYLLSDTLYIPKAIRLIGWGKRRPVLILQNYCTGFQKDVIEDKGRSKYLIWFTDSIPEEGKAVSDANAGTFYSALSNIDLSLGEGNPCAVGLRTHFAQHSFISHCRIRIGNSRAGLFDVGNELEDVTFEGGDYGIFTTRTSPSWPCLLMNAKFFGQKKAAVKTQEAGLTIINLTIKDCPTAFEIAPGFCEKLYVEDGIFQNISECLVKVPLDLCVADQINFRNLYGENVSMIAGLMESGQVFMPIQNRFHLEIFTCGLTMDNLEDIPSVRTSCIQNPVVEIPESFPSRVPRLPPQQEWINVKDLGALGDGVTDDFSVLQKAIDQYRVLYFPQGLYRVSNSLRLQKDTVLIGMNPISTRITVLDNEPAFAGFGPPKPLVESGRGGNNIINGISLDSGARNPRICACKWLAGPSSYMNDVKFYGGHGSMEPGGASTPVYNDSRTADYNLDREWDSQYWSLWITGNGGGIFKDVWSASPYAAAGVFISDTSTTGSFYAVSVEHHVRFEVQLRRVKNWSFYALQTEEEVAESSWCQPLEISDCENLIFANLYLFRVIWVDNPFPQAILTFGCHKIEFYNLHNFTQMKYTMDATVYDFDSRKKVLPWQIARLTVNSIDPRSTKARIQKLADGFDYIDAICADSRGNAFFCDSKKKRIYSLECGTQKIRPFVDCHFRPLSLICDEDDNLVVVTEYFPPKGSGEYYPKPQDAQGTAYGEWYNTGSTIKLYAVDASRPEDSWNAVKRYSKEDIFKLRTVVYPGNRWRDNNDHLSIVCREWKQGWLAPDGKTVIADCYDLLRACCLKKAVPGELFYSADEFYKRTVRLEVTKDGSLVNPVIFAEQGEYCSLELPDGTVCILDGYVQFWKEREIKKCFQLSERPACGVSISGKRIILTARNALYQIEY